MSNIYLSGVDLPKNEPGAFKVIVMYRSIDGKIRAEHHGTHEVFVVPDHGGLVEKQKVVQKVYDYCHTADDKYCGPDDVGELWEEMQAMPTIIPADKEGEG